MAKQNKYNYFKVIQGNYGCGWEDLCMYDTADHEEMATLRHDIKEYRSAEPQYAHRVVSRRVIKECA